MLYIISISGVFRNCSSVTAYCPNTFKGGGAQIQKILIDILDVYIGVHGPPPPPTNTPLTPISNI